MNKTTWMSVALGVVLSGMGPAAQASPLAPKSLSIDAFGTHTLDIYRAGSNAAGNAYTTEQTLYDGGETYTSDGVDEYETPGGYSNVEWKFIVNVAGGGGYAHLSITAEDIDSDTEVGVYLNGSLLGYLQAQGFISNGSPLYQGSGPNISLTHPDARTAITTTNWDLGWIDNGTFSIEAIILNSGGNTPWVNEIETSTLTLSAPPSTPVPLPSTGLLLGTGLAGFATVARKRRF